jgi:hypothetical protein
MLLTPDRIVDLIPSFLVNYAQRAKRMYRVIRECPDSRRHMARAWRDYLNRNWRRLKCRKQADKSPS